ncbi:hypothetical protein VRB52_20185 [Pseudomonas trivialis]|uniref:hypothetical protein n=1 Tax=Pseudomonas trivialis TaxID=200450 RepID=UPI0030CC2E4A
MKKLLPQIFRVTKAGAYGNEAPAFFVRQKPESASTPDFTGRRKSWHAPCYMLSTKTITSSEQDNKNKTNRLTHNKNNTAEAQLTDSFGEALHLGLAPQPGREQQKLP